MTIIEKIRASIQAVHGSDFEVYYHNDETMNYLADKMELPCAFVQLITTGAVEIASGQVREVVTAAVFFVDESTFDFDGDENEEIIDECKQRAFAWLDALQTDEWLSLDGVERTSRAYEKFDAILTGYALLVRLVELQGWTNCPELVGDFNNDFNNDFNK